VTEQTTSILSKRDRCIMGADTEMPCPYPATEPVSQWEDTTAHLCAYHAATESLVAEDDALALALELLEEFEEKAREHDNGPLLGLLGRARSEFTERRALTERVVEDLEAAERRRIRE
jgi:hypothetical protein